MVVRCRLNLWPFPTGGPAARPLPAMRTCPSVPGVRVEQDREAETLIVLGKSVSLCCQGHMRMACQAIGGK